MMGTMMLLIGMLLMLTPQIVEQHFDLFGWSQSLRRAFPVEAETPDDILDVLQRID